MRLLSCHIDAFGKFKNVDFEFDNELSVLYKKNGFGKTTLAEFVKAMFYSLPTNSKRANFKSERELYKPFDYDGKFGGRLTFSCKKGTFVVVRQFGSTPTLDKFFLFDAKTNLVSNAFSSNLGEELFGVGKETFENSTFFGQRNLVSGINDDMRAGLSVGVLSGDDIDNFDKAQQQIQKKIKQYRAEIKALKIDELCAENERYKAKEEILYIKLGNVKKEIKNLEFSQREIKNNSVKHDEKEISEYINKNIGLESVVEADRQKLDEKIKQKEEILRGKKLSKDDFDFLSDNQNIAKATNASRISFYMMFAGIVGAVAMLCGGILKNNISFVFGLIILIVSLIGVLGCVFVSRKHADEIKRFRNLLKEKGLDKTSLKTEMKLFEKDIGDFKHFEEEIEKLNFEIEKNLQQSTDLQKHFEMKFGCPLKNYFRGNDERNVRLLSVERQLIELNNDMKHYLENLQNVQENMDELNENISFAKQKENELQNKLNLLLKVASHLGNSRDAISNRYIEPISQRFNRYYKKFLEDGENVVIDTNLAMRFGDNFAEVDFLSAGLFDLVFICKRFALVDLLFKKEKPVLILDDPFANFDDDKINVAREILNDLKKDYQILLLTCQKSRT